VGFNDYRFRSVWSVPADTALVFDALVDLLNWPRWWPDVRTVRKIDDETAELNCRAMLPYALAFRLRRVEQDAGTGLLRVDMAGDLDGYCEAVVSGNGHGARLAIEQRVAVTRPLLRALAPIARPLLIANHAAMMWRGQRGLRSYLTPRVQDRPDVGA
jgi:hypothetical protein